MKTNAHYVQKMNTQDIVLSLLVTSTNLRNMELDEINAEDFYSSRPLF